MRRAAAIVSVLALFVLGAASCSDDGGDAPEPAADGTGALQVDDAWARSPMADVGAVYFVVDNGTDTDDRLIAADADDVADRVEIHETTMSEGQAEMAPVDGVDILAGASTAFEPGGYHVMLQELTAPLEVGEGFELVLTFEEAGEVTIEAEVREFVDDDMGDGDASDEGTDDDDM